MHSIMTMDFLVLPRHTDGDDDYMLKTIYEKIWQANGGKADVSHNNNDTTNKSWSNGSTSVKIPCNREIFERIAVSACDSRIQILIWHVIWHVHHWCDVCYIQFHRKIHITVDDGWIRNDSFTNRLWGINGNVTFAKTKQSSVGILFLSRFPLFSTNRGMRVGDKGRWLRLGCRGCAK